MSAISPIPIRLALCGAAAAGLALAAGAPTQAQSAYESGGGPDITVYAPRSLDRDPYTGAPYERVEASRVVHYGDLDLNARWGVRELRARIFRAARSACDQLDTMEPITAPDSPPCVATAVRQAMYQIPIADDLRYSDGYSD